MKKCIFIIISIFFFTGVLLAQEDKKVLKVEEKTIIIKMIDDDGNITTEIIKGDDATMDREKIWITENGDSINIDIEITSKGSGAIVAFKATSISNPEKITAVSNQIKNFIEENHPGFLVIDFEQVKFFSSQVLGLLLSVRAKLEKYGGKIVISALELQLYRVFKITNLDKIFKFFPDKESAARDVEIN